MLLTINSSVSSSLLTKSPSIPITTSSFPNSNPATAVRTPRWNPQALQFRVSSSANQTVEVASPPENVGGADCATESGADIVRKFYGGINVQDLASVEELIAEKCVYEDLVFPRPFVGRKVLFCICHLLLSFGMRLLSWFILDCSLNFKINKIKFCKLAKF